MTKDFNDAALAAARLVAKPISLASNYPAAGCFKNIQLTDLPAAMEKNGFRVGAALMRKWFTGAPFAMPSAWKTGVGVDHRSLTAQHIDTSIISMPWALRFGRTQETYLELKNAISGNGSERSLAFSQKELFNNLRKAGKLGTHATPFGISPFVVDVHETAHVNARSVSANGLEKLTDPIDDMYCALGAFTLHVAAEGVVTPLENAVARAHRVDIHSLVFYIRDCYDFSGEQILGNWNASEVRKVPSSNLYMVENASFREWRSHHQKGGDFIVFSDLYRERLKTPLTWHCKVT
ncbi:DUF6402 family protein [Acidovorax sp. SUPP2825]|uniref:DUF6402 family protein n=1 Tax=Acidovorax sp. SUPP2825 TaxID=2920879 RepID=UPI0023DE432C|nr:DUF6402 family protein [Acidovorax sp. SUPP2825]GKS95490.1 DUF6402 family protein [Acidovorax sp. SUPP2825]